jgi:hypothetical protein
VVVQDDLGWQACEGGVREAQARAGIGDDAPVPGASRDENHEAVDRQTLERGPRERDVAVVRRIEGAAEDAY